MTQTIDLKCKLRLGISVFKHSYWVSVTRKFKKSPKNGQKNLKIGPKLYWNVINSQITHTVDLKSKLELSLNVFEYSFWVSVTKIVPKIKRNSQNGLMHEWSYGDVFSIWVYEGRNGYQTVRNWPLNQNQEKKCKIFLGKKFVHRKTANNGVFGHFWGSFDTFFQKWLLLQPWNVACELIWSG